ncbi:RagB/SusD family nutrient uptake outer membrane protein [Leeuwenhoekiella parthenopeia]|uniref:RagB/SusD family nutrient uptake outer membrane protein n=1 Tax=Leeuwenhoekiella parthenopeia TaxID=2890320 RepID=A0ABS8GNM8_9FLAO|nr:RagB/SusD family nutrient uptake outer membrane protein [Leeuwenhoekiella parthenopeia]MCC4211524.1 RagB/SusD family nutrient uptake outer membrane protein [Leeuwenhoekiella parthenopeia]
MKNIVIILIGLLTLSACESLEETPFDFLSADNLYRNEADVDLALFGVYSSLNTANHDLWYFMSTSGPGESVTTRFNGGNQLFLAGLNFNPTLAHGVWWSNFYRGINRANAVIANVPGVGLEESLAEQKIAEARFQRAFFYFNLVKWFGGVPLYLEETTNFSEEVIFKPRNTTEEVYAAIIEDLQYAETRLPATWDAANFGRATSGAAKGFLGKVYLHMAGKPLEQTDKYALAAAKLKEVVDSGVYALQPDFGSIFTLENERNNELIFVRPNVEDDAAGTVLTFFAGPPNTPFANRNGQYQFGFSLAFYNSFSPDDKRRDVTMQYTYIDANGRSITYNSPSNPQLPQGGYREPGGVALGKLKDAQNDVSPFAHDNDIIYMRYADILLMLAEALNESNQAAAALPYLKLVRDRAGLPVVSTTDRAALRAIIKQERKWELAGEYQEYGDLQRWGDIQASIANNAASRRIGVTYDPKMELLPIPQGQLDDNPNLTQNPGY